MSIVIPAFFIAFFSTVVVVGLSRRGRRLDTAIYFGDIVEDLGDLGTVKLRVGKQHLHLYRCRLDSEVFLVLETEIRMPASVLVHWTRLDQQLVHRIANLAGHNN